jgi:hypothetical protein
MDLCSHNPVSRLLDSSAISWSFGVLKWYGQGAEAPTTTLYTLPLYAIGLDACPCTAKLKWTKLSQAFCSLTEDTFDCLIIYASWLLANILSESSHCFWNVIETQDTDFFFAWNIEQITTR